MLVLLALAGMALVALGFGLRAAEQAALFPAPPAPSGTPALDPGVEHAWLDTPGGRVEAFLLPASSRASAPGPLVVYAHGNGELVDYWLRELAPLQAHGAAVLLVEYPGYGRSSGRPSESTIQAAFAAGYDWAVARKEIDRTRVVGYGRSLGGGAICALGRVRPLAALVLESSFTSVRDVAAAHFSVPRFLVRSGFDNLDFVRGYTGPLLVVHGEDDQLIPVAQARQLVQASRDAVLELASCGHNCTSLLPRALALLQRRGLLEPVVR
jgi:pimeloyl-ACP methyl ester carboxylesterase